MDDAKQSFDSSRFQFPDFESGKPCKEKRRFIGYGRTFVCLFACLSLFGGCLTFPDHSALRLPSDSENLKPSPINYQPNLQEIRDVVGFNTDRNSENTVDPFLAALQTGTKVELETELNSPSCSQEKLLVSDQFSTQQDSKETKTEKREEKNAIKAESDAVTIASMEIDLLKNNWVRNHELTRWIENGMKDPNKNRNSEQLKRLGEIDRLNMSADELRKKGNIKPEYSDGLASTWRWYHPEIEKILKIQPARRPDPVDFLTDEKYAEDHYRMIRANAAILMGRTDDQLAKAYLLAAVAEKKLPVPLRCAAAETLGKLGNVSAGDLIPLIDPVKEKREESVNPLTELPESNFRQGVRDLWVELLISVSKKISPWEDPCFLEPLEALDPQMRLETVRIWQNPERYAQKQISQNAREQVQKRSNSKKNQEDRPNRLPEEFLDYARSEPNLAIRIEIVKTLGQWKEPEIFEIVRSDLNKGPALCHATFDALAEAGCREAIPLVKEKLNDSVGRNRAKAVQVLRKFESWDDVFRLQDDQAWEVRLEVARTIADRCSPQTARLARKYLSDTVKIQEATIDALGCWPIEESAPVLLEALKCNLQTTRKRALDILITHVPEAKHYNIVAKPAGNEEDHQELSVRFDRLIEQKNRGKIASVGSMKSISSDKNIRPVAYLDSSQRDSERSDEEPDLLLLAEVRRLLDDWNRPGKSWGEREASAGRLVSLKDRLLPVVEYLHEIDRRNFPDSFDDILAKVDPVFAVIVRLDAEDANDRRHAAMELNRWSKTREINDFTLQRIRRRSDGETDPQTLIFLLETLKNIDANASRQLALAMLENRHDSGELPSIPPEFRRRACESLGQNGAAEDLNRLGELLYDKNPEIVRASLEAIVGIMKDADRESKVSTEQREETVRILKSLLMQADRFLQADAAVALHVLDDPAGEETIRRLSCEKDSKIRLYALRCIASMEDPVFIPILIYLLDDRGNIRQTALKTLPKLVGQDIGSKETNDARFAELSETDRKVARWKHWAERQTF